MRRCYTIKHDVSDGGAGVRAMRTCLRHRCDNERSYHNRLCAARLKVWRKSKSLLPIFDAIIRNGKNRNQSICELVESGTSYHYARRKYFDARNQLCKLFNIDTKEIELCLDI